MPKYLFQASYTVDGLKGLKKDGASGRKEAVQKYVKSLGGKLETMYYCFGKDDVILVCDLPNNIAAASVAATTGGTGMVRIRTTPLLTIEEADKALGTKGKYQAPGSK